VPHDTPRTPQGPLALPGTYTVRLTADGKVLIAPLTIKMDPRVHATEADLEGLFVEQSKLAAVVSKSAAAELEVHSAREQLEALSKSVQPAIKDTPALKEAVDKLDKELGDLLKAPEKPEGGDNEPGLDAVVQESAGLYEEVGRADAAPTAAQTMAGEHVSEELAEASSTGRRQRIRRSLS
jgi:hypothetical protein